MQQVLRLTLAAFLLLGLQAGSSAQDVATCKAPDAIPSTHTPMRYPAISQRMGERGGSRFTVSVGTDGAVTGVAVDQSSGSQRLDDTAAAYIKANYRWQPLSGSCKPATNAFAIVVNWWLDPWPMPPGLVADEEGAEVINVRAPFIRLWALDGPVSSSGFSIGAPPP